MRCWRCSRAALSVAAERAAFNAGAAARRRLRTDALSRLLHAGPAQLRTQHTGELTATVVDRIEALDGLFAPLAAGCRCWRSPVRCWWRWPRCWPIRWPALVLVLCGLLVPVAMAAAGLGAAAASRSQFLALARLQARFLDRVRGIATIVLYGQAEAEARSLAAAADELRRRTMRVLRVAFLSSAALDLAAALAFVVLALRYGTELLAGGLTHPATALFVLLLVPEFFAPLRGFAAAYQDRLHATGAAEALADLPPLPAPPPPREVRTVAARGVDRGVRGRASHLGPGARPGTERAVVPRAGRRDAGAGRAFGCRQIDRDRDPAGLRPARPGTRDHQRRRHRRPGAAGAGAADRLDRPAPGAVRRHASATTSASPARRRPTRRSRRRRAAPGSPSSPPHCRTVCDTAVGEGGYGLSGGQAQRVAIARAFLKNAPLLLLDEPTAHLDPATEAEVLDSLRRLALGRTVILASHSSAAHGFAGRRLDIRDGRAVPARGAA